MSAARRVLCLSGSLRRVSSNTSALLAAQQLPPAVQTLRHAIGQSDALLIACPEYAHGVPGAFKNLLDWLVGSLEFPDKPVLLLNTSARGAHHAQDALCEILRTMSARLISPEPLAVALPGAGCTAAQILASPERCLELRTALACLKTLRGP